jgi:CIC family chloride channel protein
VLSLIFCKTLLAVRGLFLRLPRRTRIIQPAIGGLVIGAILLYSPAVMGVGYEYVDQALNGGLLLNTMIVLCLLKIVATIVSYTSGNAGGIFAPSLYIGAMAGGAIGLLVHRFAPFATADPGAYALVGMGTLFAGIVRAPMTSVFMIFEITQDYQILVPLMVANLLSFVISKHYQPLPVYHALLVQDGIHLPSAATQTGRPIRTAAHVMSRDTSFMAPDQTVERAWQSTSEDGTSVYLVGDANRLEGTVSRRQLDAWRSNGQASDALGTLVDGTFTHAHPDHPLDVVIDRLAESDGLLPIVSRSDFRRVEGIVTMKTIQRALTGATTKS